MPLPKALTRSSTLEHTPESVRTKPVRGNPAAFVEKAGRRIDGERGLRFNRARAGQRAVELYTDLSGGAFAGRSTAIFRRDELEEFVQLAREFATGRRSEAAVQGGAWSKDGRLMQVLCGLHLYRPGGRTTAAAVRVVVAHATTDDLLTVTLHSDPTGIGRFADEIDALLGGARESAGLPGQAPPK